MSETARCQLCGEPMPVGEEMFNYHGYSGPCPKPPLPPSADATAGKAALPFVPTYLMNGLEYVKLDDHRSIVAALSSALAASSAPTEWVTPELLAQRFHEAYERLAPAYGYKTREATAKPWADVPDPNKSLMVAVAHDVLQWLADATAGAPQPLSAEELTAELNEWQYEAENDPAPYKHVLVHRVLRLIATVREAIATQSAASGACAECARLRDALIELTKATARFRTYRDSEKYGLFVPHSHCVDIREQRDAAIALLESTAASQEGRQ